MTYKEVSFISFKAPYHANKLALLYKHNFFRLKRIEDHISKKAWERSDRMLFVVGGYNRANGYDKEQILPLYNKLADAHSKTIISFAGSDILHVEKMTHAYKKVYKAFLKRDDVIVAAVGEHMADEVYQHLKISPRVIHMPFNHDLDENISPMPEEFSVGCYMPHSGINFYGYDVIFEVVKLLQDVKFHFYSLKGYSGNEEELLVKNLICHDKPITDMSDFIKKVSCGLRITQHDGNPMSLAEYNAMGRYFIFNKPMPYCFCVKDNSPESIAEQILEARKSATEVNEGVEFYRDRHNKELFFKTIQSIRK
jgi:hypothetical protein